MQRLVLADGDWLRGHDLAGQAAMGPDVLTRVGAGHQPQPPGLVLAATVLDPTHQVALTDDAQHPLVGIDHRHGTDTVFEQETGDLAHLGIRGHADHIGGHDIGGLHVVVSWRSGMPSPRTEPSACESLTPVKPLPTSRIATAHPPRLAPGEERYATVRRAGPPVRRPPRGARAGRLHPAGSA